MNTETAQKTGRSRKAGAGSRWGATATAGQNNGVGGTVAAWRKATAQGNGHGYPITLHFTAEEAQALARRAERCGYNFLDELATLCKRIVMRDTREQEQAAAISDEVDRARAAGFNIPRNHGRLDLEAVARDMFAADGHMRDFMLYGVRVSTPDPLA